MSAYQVLCFELLKNDLFTQDRKRRSANLTGNYGYNLLFKEYGAMGFELPCFAYLKHS